jgi:hypothetical protein
MIPPDRGMAAAKFSFTGRQDSRVDYFDGEA